jgi:hypothetical protein
MDIPIEQLLYESEGTALDFKRKQYKFKGVTDPEKADLLNDILAFANAWRRETAYILIGVEQNLGGRGIVHHIDDADHIDDATLQQFVNEKTNRPIDFSYKVAVVDGKKVGVIEIPVQKQRPFFLKKQFGRLSPKVVYVRRGSALGEADPDEVARMGVVQVQDSLVPSMVVEFMDPSSRLAMGTSIDLKTKLMIRSDDGEVIPDYPRPRPLPEKLRIDTSAASMLEAMDYRAFSFASKNANFYREFFSYMHMITFFQKIQIFVKNTGTSLLENVHIELEVIGLDSDIKITTPRGLPASPSRNHDGLRHVHNMFNTPMHTNSIDINQEGDIWEMEIELGNIKPKDSAACDVICIGSRHSTKIEMKGRVLGDTIPDPPNIELTINFDVEPNVITVEQLIAMADAQRE